MSVLINFYKKQTVLNDIFKNPDIVIVNNSQLNSLVNSAKNNKDIYQISMQKVEIDTNYSDSSLYLTKLYARQYNITPKTSNLEIINNIKRYNNVEYSISISESHYNYNFSQSNKQNSEYNNYNKISNDHSIVLDTTYNYLYYLQYNKLNLMSYTLELSNGFNYDNHMLHFNIDNNYIRSINNTLYYNYNKIRNVTNYQYGIASLDDNYLKTKNISHNAFNNKLDSVLIINENFKYDIFSTLEQLKNLYNNCTNIYNTLSYYDTINNYNNDYVQFYCYSYNELYDKKKVLNNNTTYIYHRHSYETDIDFENTKLYLTDLKLNINELDILDANTIYISDLNNINLRIGDTQDNIINYKNINESNYNLLRNKTSLNLNYDNNINVNLSYNYNYKYITSYVTTSFIETSNNIFEQNRHTLIKTIKNKNTNRFVVGTSYYLNIISDIDKNIFNKSGINIKYIGSPYLTYYVVNDDIDATKVPYKKETSIKTNNVENQEITYYISYSYTHHQKITIPIENTLNICKIRNTIQKTFKSNPSIIFNGLDNESIKNKHYILSNKSLFNFDHIEKVRMNKSIDCGVKINSPSSVNISNSSLCHENGLIGIFKLAIKLNDYLIKLLKNNNLISKTNDLHYYKIYSISNYCEYYPVLNIYPDKYLNEKFFDTLLYDENKYVTTEELNTCINDIKNIYYDTSSYDSKILYLYEIDDNDGFLYFYSMIKFDDNGDIGDNFDVLKSNESISFESDVSFLNNIDSLYNDRIVNKSNINEFGKYGYDNLYRYMSLYVNHFINFN